MKEKMLLLILFVLLALGILLAPQMKDMVDTKYT